MSYFGVGSFFTSRAAKSIVGVGGGGEGRFAFLLLNAYESISKAYESV